MLSKENTELAKSLLDLAKQLFIVVLIVWFVVHSASLIDFFASRGLDVTDFLGLKNSRALLDTQSLLNTTKQELEKTKQLLIDASRRESELKPQLESFKTEVANAPQAPSPAVGRALDQLLGSLGQPGPDLTRHIEHLDNISGQVSDIQAKNAQAINSAQRRLGIEPRAWLVVFGSDNDQAAAEQEFSRAREAGFTDLRVIKRGNLFHPAVQFDNEEAARGALDRVRKISRYASGAFVTNLGRFCPGGTTSSDNLLQCVSGALAQ